MKENSEDQKKLEAVRTKENLDNMEPLPKSTRRGNAEIPCQGSWLASEGFRRSQWFKFFPNSGSEILNSRKEVRHGEEGALRAGVTLKFLSMGATAKFGHIDNRSLFLHLLTQL